MSIFDNLKNLARPYDAGDDYDDYDDYDDGFDEEEETAPRSRRSERRSRPQTTPFQTSTSSNPEDDVDVDSNDGFPDSAFPDTGVSGGFTGHVVGSNNSTSSSKQQLVLVRPKVFADATVFAGNLKEKKAVVLNLDDVEKDLARRVVDFLSGCAFAVGGSVKKVAHATYVFCPSNMVVTGELKDITAEAEAEAYV